MQRYNVTEKEIVKEEDNLIYPVGVFLKNMEDYIKNEITNDIDIKLEPSLALIVANEVYLTLNDEIILKPICKYLNIEYKEVENNDKNYYSTLYCNKFSELRIIESEEELLEKFPYIHELYTKRKRQINEALEIDSLIAHVFPTDVAITYDSLLTKYNMDKKLHTKLRNEARVFSLGYFIDEMQFIITNLSMLIGDITSFMVDINSLSSINKKKVSLILANETELKRGC